MISPAYAGVILAALLPVPEQAAKQYDLVYLSMYAATCAAVTKVDFVSSRTRVDHHLHISMTETGGLIDKNAPTMVRKQMKKTFIPGNEKAVAELCADAYMRIRRLK